MVEKVSGKKKKKIGRKKSRKIKHTNRFGSKTDKIATKTQTPFAELRQAKVKKERR
jgi:hypothetical protein